MTVVKSKFYRTGEIAGEGFFFVLRWNVSESRTHKHQTRRILPPAPDLTAVVFNLKASTQQQEGRSRQAAAGQEHHLKVLHTHCWELRLMFGLTMSLKQQSKLPHLQYTAIQSWAVCCSTSKVFGCFELLLPYTSIHKSKTVHYTTFLWPTCPVLFHWVNWNWLEQKLK